jgi:hypothetical protein
MIATSSAWFGQRTFASSQELVVKRFFPSAREFKRRAAIEPVWTSQGRSPHGPQLPRPLKRRCINATLAAVGYNFRRLIQWLRILMIRIATSFAVQLQSA